MQNHHETIERLTNWLEQHGWPQDVDKMKLLTRASIVRDESYPGCDIVRIERHRPILGTHYTKGLPMTAFDTYYMRYAVHDDGLRIDKLEDQVVECTVDVEGLADSLTGFETLDLQIERLGAGQYRIVDSVGKDAADVSNLDEAITFGDEIAEGFSDYIYETFALEEEGKFSQTELDELTIATVAAVRENVEFIIRELWRERDTNQEDE